MKDNAISENLGFFGNIWVRTNHLKERGDQTQGHKHNFDHVSLLVSGSVTVEVEGFETQTFHAPTFIVIDKDRMHKFTALEDDTLYYCVFAMRDIDGDVVGNHFSDENNPYRKPLMDHTQLTGTHE